MLQFFLVEMNGFEEFRRRQRKRVVTNGRLDHGRQMRRNRGLRCIEDFISVPEGLRFITLPLKRAGRGSLLEIGCGYGNAVGSLQEENPEIKCFGIDIAPWVLMGKRKKNCSWFSDQKVALCAADGLDLPFASNSFDAAFAFWVLGYIPDPLHVIRETYRILKPGGRAFFPATEIIPIDRMIPEVRNRAEEKEPDSDVFTHLGTIFVHKQGKGLSFDRDGWEYCGGQYYNPLAALPFMSYFCRPEMKALYRRQRRE